MSKNTPLQYFLTVNDSGQKSYKSKPGTAQSFRYLMPKDYKLIPSTSAMSVTIESDSSESNDATITKETEHDSTTKIDYGSQLEMINLTSSPDLEEHLVSELDSDAMMVDPTCQYIMVHMDIRDPLSKLKKLIEHKLNMDLSGFGFTIQNSQPLEDHKNLVDQCVQGEGIVQVNAQVQVLLKKINIVDVLKPATDYVPSEKEDEQSDDDIIEVPEDPQEEPPEEDEMLTPDGTEHIVQWQVDAQFKSEQQRLKIPSDPLKWTVLQVRHWLLWAVRQFNLSQIKLVDWTMTGKQLNELSMEDFQKIAPNDPGDVFWTHLELLRKMKLVATRRGEASVVRPVAPTAVRPVVVTPLPVKETLTITKQRKKTHPPNTNFRSLYSGAGNKSGNNGQIQLWQFLLELLTSKQYRSVIQWTGKDAEFKLCHPELVALLWGERKNKPAMNYEKLSRALRYYYDGDMISKVPGKRFVYKFVCDLKELLGYSAKELDNLVKYGRPTLNNT